MFRTAKQPIMLALVIITLLVALHGTGAAQQDTVLLRGNPNFDEAQLQPDQRTWYTRLWAAIDGETYPDPDQAAASGNLYSLGRTLQHHILALMIAFRATGDLRLLDEADRLMELARGQLADTNGDGYLNWRWLSDAASSHYGYDEHEMDEIITHNLVAFFAYVLRQNETLNARYGQHADFWVDYLLNHYIAKWETRGDGEFSIDKTLTHAYANLMSFNFYMYQLTGDAVYWEEAVQRADVLNREMVEANGTYTWDHRILESGMISLGCQPTDYARYTFGVFQEMWFAEFSHYADDAYMTRFATTIRDNILGQGIDSIAGNICGDLSQPVLHEDTWTVTVDPFLTTPDRYSIMLLACFARWDETGQIVELSEQIYDNVEDETPIRVFIPACMVSLRAESTQ